MIRDQKLKEQCPKSLTARNCSNKYNGGRTDFYEKKKEAANFQGGWGGGGGGGGGVGGKNKKTQKKSGCLLERLRIRRKGDSK